MNIAKARNFTYILAHVALFTIFFWFGFLKIIGVSPAISLIDSLREVTIPWWPIGSFNIFLGLIEIIIGILFLFKKTEKIALFILIPHMLITFLPLFILPSISWQGFLIPTLEGQYIIKNLVIIALGVSTVIGYRKTKNI